MSPTDFTNTLVAAGAVLSATDGRCAEHFGNTPQELEALRNGTVVCPLADYIRVRATGADRARFLHNFCTNDINGLQSGTCCEVFFTNVQARILAHGYVCAGADAHEIWMLPGDKDSIVNHLSRYVITEDVAIEAVAPEHQTFAVIGNGAPAAATAATGRGDLPSSENAWTAWKEGAVLATTWADRPTMFVSVERCAATTTWSGIIDAGATPAGQLTFDYHRIESRYPLIGRDLDDQNLAPEAARNEMAISYTKGCYLGQEPIARIDAMGHVNRTLCCGSLSERAANPDEGSEKVPQITSHSDLDPAKPIALAVVRSAASGKTVDARTVTGTAVSLTIE